MCVNDGLYYPAIQTRDEANEEMKRCRKGIAYFNGWLGKIDGCIGCLEQMIAQTKAIGEQCSEIIINGAPIDRGKRHYPNGGAAQQVSNLSITKYALERVKGKINKSITDLTTSLNKAIADHRRALNTIRLYPAPCGVCEECNPPAPAPTTTTTATTTQTTTTTTTSSSTTTRRTRTPHNRAVMVPLDM